MRFHLIGLAVLVFASGCLTTEEEDTPAPKLTDAEKAQAKTLRETSQKAVDAALEKIEAADHPLDGSVAPSETFTAELEAAIVALQTELDAYENAPGREMALYQIGQMFTVAQDFYGADDAYREVLKYYPSSPRYAQVLHLEFQLAESMADDGGGFLGISLFGGGSRSVEIWERLLEVAPFADFAPEALYRLGNDQLTRGEYDEAIVNFETLVRRFPNGGYRLRAEYQAARGYFLKFQGLDYDITPLEEALARFRAFIELHEEEAAAENASKVVVALVGVDRGDGTPEGEDRYTGARAMKHTIENLLAEKCYRTGEWYRGQGKESSALSYYKTTVREYPATAFAKKASKRIAQIDRENEE